MTPGETASAATVPVELSGVSVFYGEVVGLSNVSLTLLPGITGIVGPNGSGKTTLMRILCGLLAPLEGSARVLGGEPFTQAAVRARIALVPAGSSFHDDLSARRNLQVGFLARGKSTRDARALAERALEMTNLTTVAGQRYGTLSRGTRQRVKLGLALAADADLVLLDETVPRRRSAQPASVAGHHPRSRILHAHRARVLARVARDRVPHRSSGRARPRKTPGLRPHRVLAPRPEGPSSASGGTTGGGAPAFGFSSSGAVARARDPGHRIGSHRVRDRSSRTGVSGTPGTGRGLGKSRTASRGSG